MKVRIVVAAALAATVALGLSGCNLIQPQATTKHYDASDGVGVNVGDVQLRNLILISDNGTDGNLLLTAANTTGKDVTVSIQYTVDGKVLGGELTVPHSQFTTDWGRKGQAQIILNDINTAPGGILPVTFQSGNSDSKTAYVPVLTTGQPEYAGLAPKAQPTAAAGATSTGTATPAK